MNEKTIRVHQDEIDLLAEGEIFGAEREQLLKKLDQDPDGWRRCALTLLETRALQSSFDQLAEERSKKLTVLEKPKPSANEQNRSGWLKIASLATAACLLVAIGISVGRSWTGPTIAEVRRGVEPAMHPLAEKIRANDPSVIREITMAVNSIGVEDSELIALVGMEQNNRTLVYPVIQSVELQNQIINLAPPELPRVIAKKMQAIGWQVDLRKHFVSFNHPNGKRQTVPIGMLNYQYVGRETY